MLSSNLESGTWTVDYFVLGDDLGNLRWLRSNDLAGMGLPSTLVVLSNADITPPRLTGFSFAPGVVDVTQGRADIRFAAEFVDDGAGLAAVGNFCLTQARFVSPSGGQHLITLFYGQTLMSGDLRRGRHEYTATVPQFAESGMWTISFFALFDDVCNRHDMTQSEIVALGFPVSFVVVGSDPPDTAAPQIHALTPSSESLWPRNHKWHSVVVDVVVTDAADPAPTCAIIGVSNNQGPRGFSFDGPHGRGANDDR